MVEYETPAFKLYLLFIPAESAKEKKREKSAAVRWCFKVTHTV
jgi:hypothetical protein